MEWERIIHIGSAVERALKYLLTTTLLVLPAVAAVAQAYRALPREVRTAIGCS